MYFFFIWQNLNRRIFLFVMLPTVGIFYIKLGDKFSRLSTAIKYACVESSRASDDKFLPSTGEWRKKGRIREKTASCVYNIRKEEFATSSQTRDKKYGMFPRVERRAALRDATKWRGGARGRRTRTRGASMRVTAVDCIKHGRRERDTVKGARKMTAFPCSWRRDRTCARENSVERGVCRASWRTGRRDDDCPTKHPQAWRWSQCNVLRACPVPRRARWVFFFVYFLLPMRVCAYIPTPALIFDSRGDERVALSASFAREWNAIVTLPPSLAFATLDSPARGALAAGVRPAALPYLAVLWQPSGNGNRENSKFPSVRTLYVRT